MNPIQREELSKYVRNSAFAEFTPSTWEIAALIKKIERIMEFTPESHDQVAAYATAKEYEYVLQTFFNANRKVMAIKFVRQVTPVTPGLRDTKIVVDHFWAKFTAERRAEWGSDNENEL